MGKGLFLNGFIQGLNKKAKVLDFCTLADLISDDRIRHAQLHFLHPKSQAHVDADRLV